MISNNVDYEHSLLKNIAIVQKGLHKAGDSFDRTFLKDLTRQGNRQTDGVKAYFGHAELFSRVLQKL